MKVKELKDGLFRLGSLLEAFGAKRQLNNDLTKLIELMSRHEQLSVDAFCKKAALGLEGRTPSDAKRPSDRAIDHQLIETYAVRLGQVSDDGTALDAALLQLKNDKKVRLKELKVIAQGFMGYMPASNRKADLIREIRTKWAQDRRTRHKLDLLSKNS